MGIIRVILACSVLITHSEKIFGYAILNGDAAITCFYIISGFLMFYILSESYSSKKAFYINRVLRIYPAYYISLVISLVVFALIPGPNRDLVTTFQQAVAHDSWAWIAWSALSNVSLIGIDLTRYIQLNQDYSICFPNFLCDGGKGGHNLLLVPQAWTLAIEFTFYLVAPFLVRLHSVVLVLLTAMLIATKLYVLAWLKTEGIVFDETSAFVFQLSYFLMGAIAYRAMVVGRGFRLSRNVAFCISCLVTLLAFAIFLNAQQIIEFLRQIPQVRAWGLKGESFYIAFAMTVPFQFVFASSFKFDRYIGAYSYPIYVFHYVVANNSLTFMPEFAPYRGELVLAVTVFLSAIYVHTVDNRIQRIRAGVSRRAQAISLPDDGEKDSDAGAPSEGGRSLQEGASA
jgi:peptidoglycan/LPS O-acetylase OafA/YrhL